MDHLARQDLRAIAIGRKNTLPVPWAFGEARPLTREDMVLLLGGHAPSDPKAPLARISAPHHYLAKMIAEGKSDVEVSGVTGYSLARIKTLKNDPSFRELISHYEAQDIAIHADVRAQVLNLGLTAGQIIQEQLEDDPDSFSKKELIDLMAKTLDRSGHGPTSKTEISIHDPTRIIENLRQAMSLESPSRIVSRDTIEAEYTEIPDDASPSSGAEDSPVQAPGPVCETQEPQGPSRGGDEVPEQSHQPPA